MSFVQLNTIDNFAGYNQDNMQCIICRDVFEEDEGVFAHDGSSNPHTFHYECLREWMRITATCPVCHIAITHLDGRPTSEALTHVIEPEENEAVNFRRLDMIRAFEHVALTDLECPYCYENIEEDEHAYAHEGQGLPHAFHLNCIEQWSQYKRTCPICRKVMPSSNIQELKTERESIAAILKASEEGNLNDLTRLLLGREISQKDRGRAVIAAVRQGHFAIAKALLANGPITLEARNEALAITQSSDGSLALMRQLFSTTNRNADENSLD